MPDILLGRKRQRRFLSQITLILFLVVGLVHAQVAPQLTGISPRGAQRGQTIEITLDGKNISETAKVWFNKTGINAEITKKSPVATVRFNGSGISGNIPNNPRLVVSFQIAPDAPLGTHQVRLITPNGVSNPQNFIVGNLPEIAEQEPNSTMDAAQMLELPVTVSGTVSSIEDADLFRFKLKKGAQLICDISAQRIGSPLDSHFVLFDPSGTEVVESGIGNGLDSFINYTTAQAGEYTLQLRDIRYQGGGNYLYRLSIGELPYLQSIFPLGAKRGTAPTVNVAGANLGSVNAIQLDIGTETPLGSQELRVSTPGGLETNPHPFAIGEFNETTEKEPNNDLTKENKIGTPITVNGKIEKAGDMDRFSFKVEKGARFVFEVAARGFQSKLDPLLTLYSHKKGETEGSVEEQVLSINDDASGTDARLSFAFPAAGDYAISVRDLNGAGGGDYPYRLTIRPLNPGFRVNVGADNPRISRGGTLMTTVSVARLDGFNGALRFYSPDLPKGFIVSPTILYPGQNQAVLTITAPPDAPLGLHPFSIVGVGAIGGQRIESTGSPKGILLTVMDTPPFTLTFADVDLRVVHNKSTSFHVIANRRDGFNGPIALSMQGIPPRITGGKATIPAGQNSAVISLRAGTVERREQFSVVPTPGTAYVSVSGTANVNRENVTEAAPVIPLNVVAAPYIVTVEPLRFSIVFPATETEGEPASAAKTDSETTGEGETVAVANPAPAAAAAENAESPPKSEPITKSATLTVSVVRQGGFTDVVTITPIGIPEGITVSPVTIPVNGMDVKFPLAALSSLEPKTYQVRFRASAIINGKPFEQDSPAINVKIIR